MRFVFATLLLISSLVHAQTFKVNNLQVSGTATIASGSNLNTPSTLTLTNALGLPIGGIAGLGTGVGTALANAVTGSGAIVLSTSPTLATPNLGTPAAVNLVNGTGLPVSGIASVAANTVVANFTSSSAAPTAFTMPSCSTSSSALQFTASTGVICGTVAQAGANSNITSFSGITTPLSIAQGGTGTGAITQYNVVVGTSNAYGFIGPNTSGYVLTSNGSSSYPSFQAIPWGSPGPIGSTTPSTGAFTTLTASVHETATASQAAAVSGTAYTLYTFSNTAPQTWLVSANIGTTGDTTHYDAFAIVITDGSSARIAFSNFGSLMSITLSGLNLQVTQSSSVNQTINVTLTRVG